MDIHKYEFSIHIFRKFIFKYPLMTPFKNTLATFAITAVAFSSGAQQADDAFQPPYAGKQTATDSRLLIHTNLQYGFGVFYPYDSTVYRYSGTRSSINTFQMYDTRYDEGIRYRYDYPTNSYYPDKRLTQTFDASDKILTQATQKWTPATNTWRNYLKTTKTYDADNNLIFSTTQGWDSLAAVWKNLTETSYVYTPTGKIHSQLNTSWDGSAWKNVSIDMYSYNAADDVDVKRTDTWSTSWTPSRQEHYEYDGSGVLIGKSVDGWYTSSGTWSNTSKIEYSNFVGSQPQQELTKFWNGTIFSDKYRRNMLYNADGQLRYYNREEWRQDQSKWVGYSLTPIVGARYYYGTEVSVAPIAPTQLDCTVFPVPANNEISIAMRTSALQPIRGTISNVEGKTFNSFSMKDCNNCIHTINVAALPQGLWILRLYADGEVIARHFSIER